MNQFMHANKIMDVSSVISRFNALDEDFEILKKFQPTANKNLDTFLDDFYIWMPSLPEYKKFFGDTSLVPRVKAQQKEYWRSFFCARLDQDYINSRLRVGRAHAQINLPINTYCVGMNFSTTWWLERIPKWVDKESAYALMSSFYKFVMIDLTIITESYSDLTNDKIKDLLNHTNSILDKTTVIAESMSRGDYSLSYEATSEQDQRLAVAINRMLDTFKNVVKQTTLIAQGNYRAEIAALSEKDELGTALFQMTKNLRELSEKNQQDTWIKNGQTELSNLMRGNQELHELGRNVISYLAKYVNALMGTFYVMAEDKSSLRLIGTFAHTRRKGNLAEIQVGEGLVGQCAIEKETIIFSDVPENYVAINSSLGNATPNNIIVVPLMLDNQVFGVIELASMKSFTDIATELLNKINESIAVAIKSAKDAERIKKLLQESNIQATELQAQQQELKAANEELQEQQEKLTISNQELEHQALRLKESEENIKRKNEELIESKTNLERQKHELEVKSEQVENAKNIIETKAKELELSSKYKSEFLANMSHELRTPLNSLLILSENLASNDEGNLTPEQIESARVILSGGKDLLNLINDILDLSKVEAGKLQINIDKFEVSSIISNLKSQFEPVAKRKAVKFCLNINNNIPKVLRNDSHRLEQILKNFLSNAFKFTSQGSVTLSVHTPPAGTIFKRAELNDNRCVGISVTDTGIGIPKEKQAIIFEAFQQVDGSTSRKYGGTGLGLSISRELARILGCEIKLHSEANTGSTFTLYIPIDFEEEPLEEQNKIKQTSLYVSHQEPSSGPLTNGKAAAALAKLSTGDDRGNIDENDKTLLIIEDDEAFARTLMNEAQKRGYKCVIAHTGLQGLQLAFELKPQAITLDMKLPDTSALKILEQLKSTLSTRHIPVHIASVEDEDIQTKQRGAIGHLKKPATTDDLQKLFLKIENMQSDAPKKVLIIEDDIRGQRAIITKGAHDKIKFICASTGKEAFDILKSEKFDCIILDLNLPDISGMDLLPKLKKELKTDLPPIIIYTGKDLSKEEVTELNRMTNSIVVKGAVSSDRLIDELHLFLHSVDNRLPDEHKKVLQTLHEPEMLLKNKKVLLVDDDMRNTFALSASLRKKGLRVIMADNGEQAIIKLKSESDVDLIIMDIMMPVMDGYEAMTQIRQMAQFASLPIIALTAKVMPEDKVKALECGASDFMTKPVDVQKLLTLMNFWLGGEMPSGSKQLDSHV